jgi:signal transduction histidine kinase
MNLKALHDHLHDMRSPLAALILSLDLFENRKIGPLNKKQTEIVKNMRQSVEKLRKALTSLPQDLDKPN